MSIKNLEFNSPLFSSDLIFGATEAAAPEAVEAAEVGGAEDKFAKSANITTGSRRFLFLDGLLRGLTQRIVPSGVVSKDK